MASLTYLRASHGVPGASDGSLGRALRSGAAASPASADTARALPLNAEENQVFLRIVRATPNVNSHAGLLLFLQNEVWQFIPHQILICAWGNFRGSNLGLTVISPLPGVRNMTLDGCGIEQLLKTLFARWVANGRQQYLLDDAAVRPLTSSACSCALHLAMHRMSSLFVHGVHGRRDQIDSLYVALNPDPIVNGQNLERFHNLVDPVIAQVDIAFRQVTVQKPVAALRCVAAAAETSVLTCRETEIMRCVSDGQSNLQIADGLCISLHTVKSHMARIFRKLRAANRTDAAAKHRHNNPDAPT